MTNRYKKGQIYKLVNDVDDYEYVGSTCLPLRKRLYWHKTDAKWKDSRKVYQHLNEIGWENVKIILVEEYPCENKQQLLARERYWYDRIEKKLNTTRPFRDEEEKREYVKEYHEQNKEKLLQKKKEYYENNQERLKNRVREYHNKNREIIIQRNRERVNCSICEKEMSRSSLSRHMKTQHS